MVCPAWPIATEAAPAFAEAAGCDPEAAECLSEQDRADIVATVALLGTCSIVDRTGSGGR